MNRDDLMTLDEVLQTLEVSRTTIWRWQRNGEFPLPDRQQGRKRYWLRSTIETWIKGGRDE